MIKKGVQLLKTDNGSAPIMAVVVILSLLLIVTSLAEYLRLKATVESIRAAVESSIISVATTNYDELYNGIREGYSGGYGLTEGDVWVAEIDSGDLEYSLAETLGLEDYDNYYEKVNSNGYEYRLSNFEINLYNTPLAPGDGSGERFEAEATLSVEIPLSFGWQTLPPLKIDKLKVFAGFTQKF